MVIQIQQKTLEEINMGSTGKSKLVIKFLDGPRSQESFTFLSNMNEIKIGRMSDCDIKINDSSLSRYQCL